jgi:F-box domain
MISKFRSQTAPPVFCLSHSSRQMSNSQVPPELIFEILRHLSAGHTQGVDALRASSLLCSSLRDFCQRKLFTRIILDVGSSDEGRGKRNPCDRLVEILRKSPHLVCYARSLVVLNDSEDPCDSFVVSALRILAKAPITIFKCIIDGWVS